MPLFRRKTETKLPRVSSISLYGQGKAQSFHNSKNSEKLSDSGSFSSIDLEDRPYPLVFAEATYDPSLPIKTKSRLSKDLQDVLHDNAALAYFIQFMDAQEAKHLVKFWLEAESFRASLETKRKNQNVGYDESTEVSMMSSVCELNKSENVFQNSSQAVGQNLVTLSESLVHENINTRRICNVLNSTCTEIPSSNSDSDSSKFSKVEQNSSVDSGCEDETVSNFVSRDISKCLGDGIPESESIVNKLHCDKLSVPHVLDQNLKLNVNKEKSQLLVNFVRLETSIEEDAYSIYSKYISADATFPLGLDEELRITIKNSIKNPSSVINSQCFVPAQEFVVRKMDEEYFPIFLRSSFHCKHQIDVLTSGTVYLADVLYNDSALFFFMEFMEQEGVRHLVDFLLMADNFQKHLLSQENYDWMQAQTDAMVVYEKFFSLQATTPLGFSDEVRYEVEANICREEGPLPDCFLKPVKILTQYLEKTYLLQFLNSQLYFKYISECIILIQTGGTNSSLQKYPGSDSGSEQSIPVSSLNTLLAVDSKQMGTSKIIKNLDDKDLRIDCMQFEPDALWKRPMAGKLQMAHVDHLGRVTVDFEPEPDKRKESRISKAVKKLVNWDEDKNQEDMAWKVAEMIVKDICSVTMSESERTQESPS